MLSDEFLLQVFAILPSAAVSVRREQHCVFVVCMVKGPWRSQLAEL